MASPRMWNISISASQTVANNIVGGTSTPFGPATIYISNGSTTDSAWVLFTNMGANTAAVDATATSDGTGNSWQIPASGSMAFNFGSQDSTEKYNVSVIMATGKTGTVIVSAIQAQ